MNLIPPPRKPGRPKTKKNVDIAELHQDNLRMLKVIQTYQARKIQEAMDTSKPIPDKVLSQFLDVSKIVKSFVTEGRLLTTAATNKFKKLSPEELDARLKAAAAGT